MRKVSSFCDYFVILSGDSLRHTKALADAIEKELEKDNIKPLASPPKGETPWVALDYTDIVVHIFHKPVRQYYSLERLWQDAPHVRILKKKNERKKT
jgi:ribosome-associated protein